MDAYKMQRHDMLRAFSIMATLTIILCLMFSSGHAVTSPYEWAFIDLDYAKKEKSGQLKRFFDHMHNISKTAVEDNFVG